MNIREKLEYVAVAGLLGVCRRLPKPMVYALFKGFGRLSPMVLPARRKLALRNTEIVFPDMPLQRRKAIVRRHFVNLAESMAMNTLVLSGRFSNEELLGMVDVECWHAFEQAHVSSDGGILVYSGHLGNWELLPQYVALRTGRQINVIARKSNNALLEERIVSPLRERIGVNVFFKKNALMKLMKAIRKGETAGMLIDQRLNLQEGIAVPFFGREAGTTASPALLQIRFGITVVPIFMVKGEHHRYKLLICDPVEWTDNGRPMDEQVLELTKRHQRVLEEMITRYPDQWFWVHDRWGLKKGER